MKLIRLGLCAVLIAAAPTASRAATIVVSTGAVADADGVATSALPGVMVVDFNAVDLGALPTVAGLYSYTGDGRVVVGDVVGQYAAPPRVVNPGDDPTRYLSVPINTTAPNTMTVQLYRPHDYFGLLWGSTDSYNRLSFYAGNTLLASFVPGSTLPAAANGDQVSPNNNQYFNFLFTAGWYDRIVFESSNFAFESDNHAFRAVPEPATMALLGAGLLGLAGSLRRRQ